MLHLDYTSCLHPTRYPRFSGPTGTGAREVACLLMSRGDVVLPAYMPPANSAGAGQYNAAERYCKRLPDMMCHQPSAWSRDDLECKPFEAQKPAKSLAALKPHRLATRVLSCCVVMESVSLCEEHDIA